MAKRRDQYGSIPSPADREKLEGVAQHLAQLIGALMDPEDVSFFLILAKEEPSWSTYVANADRESSVQLLRETASRLEHRSDVPPGERGDDEPSVWRFTALIKETLPDGRLRMGIAINSTEVGELVVSAAEGAALTDLLYREQEVQ